MAFQEQAQTDELSQKIDKIIRWNGYVELIGNIYRHPVLSGEQHYHLLGGSIFWRRDTQRLGKSGKPLKSAMVRDLVGYNASDDIWYHTYERTVRGQLSPDITQEPASVDDIESFRDHILASIEQELPGIYEPRTRMLLDATERALPIPVGI